MAPRLLAPVPLSPRSRGVRGALRWTIPLAHSLHATRKCEKAATGMAGDDVPSVFPPMRPGAGVARRTVADPAFHAR